MGYDGDGRDNLWKTDDRHKRSLTGEYKKARKSHHHRHHHSYVPQPNSRGMIPREGKNNLAAVTSPHGSAANMGRGGQQDKWREGWQEGQGQRSYGGDVAQGSGSSSMDGMTRGKYYRNGSNARSGRENISGGGCDPPPPHGIGVGGVRQHSSRAAGYDGSGLRDRAAVDLHTTPRMERERENGEIIEGGNESPPYHQDPPPDTIPIFKDYASLANEGGSIGKDLVGQCNVPSSFPSKPPSCYGGGSMLTLKERAEKEDEKERWVAECRRYPRERERLRGDHSSHALRTPPSYSLYHDQEDSTHKRYGFFHSTPSCGSGGLGRDAVACSRWEGESLGGGEVQSSVHSSHQQKGMVQYDVAAAQQRGSSDSIICEDVAEPPRREQKHVEMGEGYDRTHRRIHTDPVAHYGMILVDNWDTATAKDFSRSHRKHWSSSEGISGGVQLPGYGVTQESSWKDGGELGGAPQFQAALPKLPNVAAATEHPSSLPPPPPPSTYGSSQVKACGGAALNTTVVIPSNELDVQEEREGVMRMDSTEAAPPPCNQGQMMVSSSSATIQSAALHSPVVSFPALPPAPHPEMKLDPLDEGRRELRSELDKYLICEMQYQEASFYFKVLGHRIEKSLMSR